MIKEWLAHPLTRGLDLDDPDTTNKRRQIIQEKKFLRRIYEEWYAAIAAVVPEGAGAVLELGSGAGFLEEYISGLITSEIFYCPGIRTVLDGQRLPFADGGLRGILMTDVLHHLPQTRRFFTETARCVRRGGVVAMIEPWVTPWSQLVYTHLHHEPFQPQAPTWEFPTNGPLSGANGALPWMIFVRDRTQFEQEFPEWQIETIKPMMPFRYLVSGGVSLRSLTPVWSYDFWRTLENGLGPWLDQLAMFARIVLRRR